jgi:hypothetical protein
MNNKLSFYKENTVTINLNFSGVDLTGATVYFTMKSSYDDVSNDSSAIISKNITSHINASAGETAVVLTPAETDVPVGNYYYDIKLKKADGVQQTIQSGRCRVLPVVTNRG